jgi:hypothetical protein
MTKLQCWILTMTSIVFGISDRIINSILNNYSIDSLVQILIGAILLLLVNQLYPYNHLGE